MSKRKSALPPPNQLSMRAFISGGSTGWKVGDSPLLGEKKQQHSSQDQKFESEIHDRIVSAGIFQYFLNQPAALSYLNGQFMLRKKHLIKLEKLEKSVRNFEKSGLTRRFMKCPSKLLPQDKQNCEQELSRADRVMGEIQMFKKELILLKKNCVDENESVKPKRK